MKADDAIGGLLARNNLDLAEELAADVLLIRAPIRFGLDDEIRHVIENLHEDECDRKDRLCVLVETTGGYIEVVERIHNVFRRHYGHVIFVVPNFAYSAGTVLVLSGDEILMDYYSVLGPIDPQFESKDGSGFVPGMGYLTKFKELAGIVNEADDPSKVKAELAFLLNKFDPAQLFQYEEAQAHSVSLLEEWLPKYKFKEWKITEGSGIEVTDEMRKRRAVQIAQVLGNAAKWHSHGRGIGLKELRSDDIKLEITNFEDNKALNEKIRSYYDLFIDYCSKIGARGSDSAVLHARTGLRSF